MAHEPDAIAQMRRALGQRLATFRQSVRLTQGGLAKATYYDRSRIAHLERGSGRADRQFWEQADIACQADGGLLTAFVALEAAKAELERQTHDARLSAIRAQADRFRRDGGTGLAVVTADAAGRGARGTTLAVPPASEETTPRIVLPDAAEDAWQRSASQADAAIELGAGLLFDIAPDGWARLTCRHELVNLSSEPVARLNRELWFEHTDGPLRIEPVSEGPHRVAIQRIHDTGNLTKFACLVSPAIRPGETAVVGYACDGGQFVSDHYWQQTVVRYTRHLALKVRHRGARRLVSCTATKDHVDGAQHLLTDGLEWDEVDGDVMLHLSQSYLKPNEIVTLRWEVNRGSA